ncbi:MAG TPA: AAA family ATPase [Acetobacteraceae bacterium]|nr:AAA family ATPase [Acetobacteraceae bacterium]
MAKVLPPLRFVLQELLPVGYTVLAGPPKLGKSWLLLQLGLAVAAGEDLFGQGTAQGAALYLALEDGEHRMQGRMRRLLGDRAPPAGLSIATKWPRLDAGGMAEIELWAKANGDAARLCIIDTTQKIKPPPGRFGTPRDHTEGRRR